jgi:hypothetical protein
MLIGRVTVEERVLFARPARFAGMRNCHDRAVQLLARLWSIFTVVLIFDQRAGGPRFPIEAEIWVSCLSLELLIKNMVMAKTGTHSLDDSLMLNPPCVRQ